MDIVCTYASTGMLYVCVIYINVSVICLCSCVLNACKSQVV